MKKLFAIAALFALLFLARPLHADGYCGDDICQSGESCSTCIWDCGICPNESGSSGTVVITKPANKTLSIWDGGTAYLPCPVSSSSYTASGGFNTTVRFKILNPSGSSTGAFRLTLSSTLGWFVPKNLTYAQPPDNYDSSGNPYWDIPPLGRNESTEVFFTVKGSVGLIDQINLAAAPLSRWQGACARFAQKSGALTGGNISRYLDSLNWSQGVAVYYEYDSMTLARLGKNGSFAAFSFSNTNVTAMNDSGNITLLVSKYAAAASQPSTADVSKPYQTLILSEYLKTGPENNCMMITGMDKHECVDRPTCRLACASVPVCWYVGQVGWPFIDGLLTYRLGMENANAALGRAANSSYAFSQAPSNAAAETALSDMEDMNRYETAVIYHPIFTKYNFCPPPQYAMPQMIDARRQLLNYLDDNCVRDQEARIVSESVSLGRGLKAAEEALAERVAAEALANLAANMSGNASGSNMTINVTGAQNGSTGANASGNATQAKLPAMNGTADNTGNTGIGQKGGAANATHGNASTVQINVTIPPQLRALEDAGCRLPAALLFGLLVVSFFRKR